MPLHIITNGLIGFLPPFDVHVPNPLTLLIDLLIHKLFLILDFGFTEIRYACHGNSIAFRPLSDTVDA